jgi:hypothetical protein
MSTRLAGASVTHERALKTCKLSRVSGQLGLSLFLWSTARWGPWGTWQHRSHGTRYNAKAHLDKEASSGAVEHVTVLELSSQRGRAQSHGTRGSVRAHLGREAGSRAEKHVAAPELSSRRGRAWGHGLCGGTGAHLSKEVRSGAVGHVVAPEPTSTGRCGPKLQLEWQGVDVCPAPYLDLELVCGGTRSSGCRQLQHSSSHVQ